MKVLIADDDPAIAEYLKKVIEEVPGVAVVSIARDGKETIRQVEIYLPDVVFLDIDIFIESRWHKILIKTEKGEHLEPGKLCELERQLDPLVFFRCHRGYLVNLEKIREIVPSGQAHIIILHSGDRVSLSREREKVLLKKLGI